MNPVLKERRQLRPEDLAQIARVLGAVPEKALQLSGESLSANAPVMPASHGLQKEALLSRFEESRQRIREAIARRSARSRKTAGGSSEGS